MILLTRMRSVPVACACTSWPIQRASAAAVLQIVPAAGTRATFSPVSERKMIGAGVPQACLRIGAVGSHSKASPASRREPSVRAVEISSHDHESCQSTHHLTIADAIGSIAEGLLCRSATSVRARKRSRCRAFSGRPSRPQGDALADQYGPCPNTVWISLPIDSLPLL